MLLQGIAGPELFSDGVPGEVRIGRLGDLIVSELHGRYYEANYRGAVFSGGMALTSISNVIWTTGTTDATSKGICGVYNPSTSPVNLVILQAMMGIVVTNATNTGTGPFVWSSSIGNTAISTGTAPYNRGTGVAAGSWGKDMCGIALTGLTTALAPRFASCMTGGSGANFSFVGTAAGQVTFPGGVSVENFDGSLIVPPGGVLVLQGTTTGVAHSAVGGIVWEEVPVK